MLDAVVVGAGPNGLAAALTLARAGRRVAVLEAADEPGGGTRSYADPVVPGLVHDHCAAVFPLGIGSPFLSRLPLGRYGLEWCHPEVACAHPLDDGTAPAILADLEATVVGLGADGPTWRRLYGPTSRRFDAVAADLLRPVLRVPRRPLATARAGLVALAPATRIASRFPTPAGAALFGGIAAHTVGPLDRAATSAVALVLGAAAHAHGWPVARGGAAAVWRAMVAMLEDLGGEVVTGTRVRALADLPPARAVLLYLPPRALAEVAGDALPPRARHRALAWRHGPGAFKLDLAVRGGVPWTAAAARRAGTLHLGGTFGEIAEAEAAVARGEHPARPFVLVTQPHVADASRAVDGVVPVWTYAHVPAGSDVDVSDAIVAQLERFAPGVTERIVARHARGPAALEADNANLIGGDITGGVSDLSQLLARPRLAPDPYRTAVDGVWLCSSSTAPGAGVHGMCGHHAARSVLRALGARRAAADGRGRSVPSRP
jgi:phytoene dehydrogenase-like protein